MKHTAQRMFGLAMTLSLATAGGCDDGNGSSSGVSGSKTIDEVTQEEAKKVCEWMADTVSGKPPSHKQACTVVAVEETSSAAQCAAVVEVCEEELAENPPEEEEAIDCDFDFEWDPTSPGCSDVTVGQFESCIKQLKQAFDKYYADASCEDAGEEPEEPNFPAVCEQIADDCPEIMPADLGTDLD